jgi:Protein of unknown function (DUF1559)
MSRMNDGCRSGLTRLELLVLAFIAGVAVLLFWPFLFRLRGKADSAQCLNNLRKLVLACQDCSSSEKGFVPPYHVPAPGMADSVFSTPGNEGSLFYWLLPYLESSPLYSEGIYTGPTGAQANSVFATAKSHKPPTVPPTPPFNAQRRIRIYLCPSDPTVAPGGIDPNTSFGSCSYACNYLAFGNPRATPLTIPSLDNPDNYDPTARPPNKAPAYLPRLPGGRVKQEDTIFRDGLSTTFLFAEKYAGCQWFRGGSTSIPEPGGNLWAPGGDSAQYAPAFAMESPWNDGTRFQMHPSPGECNVAYPQTGHLSGMNVVMADGSGRTIAPTISVPTFLELCTPDSEEIVRPDS